MNVSSYQTTDDASELFILEELYIFLHSKIEENTILLGRISDQLECEMGNIFRCNF